ncbi:MAG: hypothetical protein Q9182_005308 [Xanthomendoza sp. 2 TL-2023]
MFLKSMTPLLLGCHVATAINQSSNESINWFPCKQNGTLPLTCGTLNVPLDYTNATSDTTLELQLVKVSAVKHPKKGNILFNPGGPGAGGQDLIAASAVPLQIVTGGTHDLIGFDPRFTSFLNASDTTIGQAWAARTVCAEACYQSNRDIGEMIGTGFVARDMMQIVDALDEEGLLNYWGFSYGTALGATVAAMFPDRVGRVVLGGCLNPHDYYAGNDLEQTTKSDAGFDGFFEGCVAHPESCAFAEHGTTAEELKNKFYNLLYSVKSKPYVLLEQFYAKSQIFGDVLSQNLLTYAQWPFHAKGAYTGNFRVKTRNPILLIGSEVDALTPLVSARNASAGFEGSVVLQHGGYGYTSLGQPSLCTAKAIRAYFANGTLPAAGTKCEPTFGVFENVTVRQEFGPIANFTRRTLDSDGDRALLSALAGLGGEFTRRWGGF